MQEQDLILVVNFCLGKPLVTLISYICQTLLKAHFLGVVELLKIGKLLLGCHINLIDRVL